MGERCYPGRSVVGLCAPHGVKGESCPSQNAIKRIFGICCSCWEGSPTNFPVREGPVLNNVPSQLIWNWHREWKYFFDRKHPLCIEHKVAHGTTKLAGKYNPMKHGVCDPSTGVAPRGSNMFFVTSSSGSIGSYTHEKESHQFTVKAIVQSGPNRGRLGRRIVEGHWYQITNELEPITSR